MQTKWKVYKYFPSEHHCQLEVRYLDLICLYKIFDAYNLK
jgi:hypothetical protein